MDSNVPGPRDHLITRALERRLETLESDLRAEQPLDPAEGPERLARHAMEQIRGDLGDLETADEQAGRINEILETFVDEEARDAQLELPPRLLTGIRGRSPLGDPLPLPPSRLRDQPHALPLGVPSPPDARAANRAALHQPPGRGHPSPPVRAGEQALRPRHTAVLLPRPSQLRRAPRRAPRFVHMAAPASHAGGAVRGREKRGRGLAVLCDVDDCTATRFASIALALAQPASGPFPFRRSRRCGRPAGAVRRWVPAGVARRAPRRGSVPDPASAARAG